MIDEGTVNAALDVLRPMLNENGFGLRVGRLSADGVVEVILDAGPEACLDCLAPEDVMTQILDDAIRKRDAGFARVRLVKAGFESTQPH